MEACIARGGISHVLSQARASLKNPSRPYTPRTTARPLFHGDDYRSGSRPSSSYTVTEQNELQQRKQNGSSNRGGDVASASSASPSASMLPPRSSAPKKKKSSSPSNSSGSLSHPEDPDPSPITIASSASHLKLVHAPVVSDDEKNVTSSHHDIYRHEGGSDADSDDAKDEDDHLEASLELPSQDQLYQTYSMAECSLEVLASLSDPSKAADTIENLRSTVSSFLHLGSFFLSNCQLHFAAETTKVQELRSRLFHAISSVVLEQWNHSAKFVLALTPCLFELYMNASPTKAADNANFSSGQQAVSLGKLLFMLSKESANDAAFCNVQYVEATLSVISKGCGSLHSSKAEKQQQHRCSKENRRENHETTDSVLQIDSNSLAFPMKMLIYIAGTLKNTSTAEEKMIKLLATNGAIAILSNTMLWRSNDPLQAKEIAQFLIQTTGTLRNLSVVKSYHKQFIEAQIPSRLCNMIPAFISHLELMGNVSRILSKLTLHELPRAQINQRMAGDLRNLMAVVDCEQNKSLSFFDHHRQQQQQRSETRFQDILLVRMFFVLGNLCAGNDRNRLFIAFDCKGIAVLLQALQFYTLQYAKQRELSEKDGTSGEQGGEDDGCSTGTDHQSGEVLVKLARLLANLAINAEVGAKLNSENTHMSVLLETLDQAQRVGDEELMLNIVSCITNLSYYSTPTLDQQSSSSSSSKLQSQSFIEGNRIVITSLLAPSLLDRNEEAVVEATRAFGNLTRFKDVLCYMSEHKVLDCFVVLLDHSNREIVYTVCGVLMNAALDKSTRTQLLRVRPESGDDDDGRGDVRNLLLGIVECAATDDVEMTCIACKVLYNLLLANERKGGHYDSDGGAGVLDSKSLHRVVQQIIKTMDAQDTRRSGDSSRHVNQRPVAPAARKNSVGRDENEDDGDGEDVDDDDLPSGWRELRLVLPQLLRSAGN